MPEWKTAREYWKDRFGEYPQNDADRLAVAMMTEYYHDITKEEVVKNNLVKPDVSGLVCDHIRKSDGMKCTGGRCSKCGEIV